MNRQSGFTLIELVVVIVILGILAAQALPRFADLQEDARAASVNGVGGGVRAAASLAHSVQLAKGYPSGQTVTLEGTGITMTNAYPDLTGIRNALSGLDSFTYDSATGNFNLQPAVANCLVDYDPAAANAAPSITITTTGC